MRRKVNSRALSSWRLVDARLLNLARDGADNRRGNVPCPTRRVPPQADRHPLVLGRRAPLGRDADISQRVRRINRTGPRRARPDDRLRRNPPACAPGALSVLTESEPGSNLFLTRFLHANRYPLRSKTH
jgi:hypothetical protein